MAGGRFALSSSQSRMIPYVRTLHFKGQPVFFQVRSTAVPTLPNRTQPEPLPRLAGTRSCFPPPQRHCCPLHTVHEIREEGQGGLDAQGTLCRALLLAWPQTVAAQPLTKHHKHFHQPELGFQQHSFHRELMKTNPKEKGLSCVPGAYLHNPAGVPMGQVWHLLKIGW